MTANGNNGTLAFSEEKLSPSIFVYIFPEFQLKNELKGKIFSPSLLCNCHNILTGTVDVVCSHPTFIVTIDSFSRNSTTGLHLSNIK